MRIAATLLAMAALADRAALRSLPVRLFVLGILSHAEAIARKFVAGELESRWRDGDDSGSHRPPHLLRRPLAERERTSASRERTPLRSSPVRHNAGISPLAQPSEISAARSPKRPAEIAARMSAIMLS